MKGVLIRRVDPSAPASAVLKQFDILLAFDGVEISKWAPVLRGVHGHGVDLLPKAFRLPAWAAAQ